MIVPMTIQISKNFNFFLINVIYNAKFVYHWRNELGLLAAALLEQIILAPCLLRCLWKDRDFVFLLLITIRKNAHSFFNNTISSRTGSWLVVIFGCYTTNCRLKKKVYIVRSPLFVQKIKKKSWTTTSSRSPFLNRLPPLGQLWKWFHNDMVKYDNGFIMIMIMLRTTYSVFMDSDDQLYELDLNYCNKKSTRLTAKHSSCVYVIIVII